MPNLNNLARLAGAAVISATLTACASSEDRYPSLGNIQPIKDTVLTPEQRAAEMEEMRREQQTHTTDARKEIEKR